jgi:dTDP-4-amino-4,6-dideoxygalactose transaminase
MQVKFNDLNKINDKVQQEIDQNVQDVINKKSFLPGDYVRDFTKKFEKLQGLNHCIPCSSGTMALYCTGKILDIKEGDEIICPVHTFIASVAPFVVLGAKPVFVDVNPHSFVIDETKIEQAITEKTKAILVVHLYGNPCKMKEIRDIANKYQLKLIEDCAHAHFAKYKGKSVGTFGDANAFSFNPGKNLGAYGDAGLVSVNNLGLYQIGQHLVDHGRVSKYEHDSCGLNLRMDEIQGAVLSAKVGNLTAWANKRRNVARIYSNHFVRNGGVKQQLPTPNSVHAYHLFPVLVKNRDYVMEHMMQNGIQVGNHYPIPLHLQKAFENLGYKEGDFPVAEKIASEVITLPIYPDIPLDQINYVAEKLNEVTI